MVKKDPLPDHLRCNRNDGRDWRCNRLALEGKKLCEVHHLQGLHRQHKERVPESLKIQRKISEKSSKKVLEKVSKKRGNVGASEALDGALKKMKLKRGDLHLELIRVFLKRQVEKKKEREFGKSVVDREERELPNGLMEISPGENLNNLNSFCNVKLGFDPNSISKRRFRSKNIEPVPIGTVQVLPFGRDVAKLKKKNKKKCHWCRKISYCSLVQCSFCKKEWFCKDCISERSSITEERVKIKCPVCQKTCDCRSCLKSQSENSNNKIRKIEKFQYVIYMLLPVLKQVNLEQRTELEFEAKLTGVTLSELQIRRVESNCNKQYFCNNCQTSMVNIHRSCKNCPYNLCLRCAETSRGSLKSFLSKFRNNSCGDDGNIICPPVACGDCGDGPLNLKRIFPSGWTQELESRAEEIIKNCDFQENIDGPCSCGETNNKECVKASSRKKFGDNFLCYIDTYDFCGEKVEHFRKHWGEGHPVIVRREMRRREISWDPIDMFCDYLEKTSTRSRNGNGSSKNANCLDWCELEICRKQIFMGSLEGKTQANMRDETMKLKLYISSTLFQQQFPNYYSEIISALPLQDYTNPISGIYNLASNIPSDTKKPEFGPSIHISFGGLDDFSRADFATKLFSNPHDMVNILVHASDEPISTEHLTKIKNLMKKCNTRDDTDLDQKVENESEEKSSVISGNSEESSLKSNIHQESTILPNDDEEDESDSDCEPSIRWSGIDLSSDELDDQKNFQSHYFSGDERTDISCGAQWDVFRRQDVSKLVEYLSRHSNNFGPINNLPENIVHPIYDQYFYLDEIHKFKLKEEFDIEPWTFKQHLGEAVIVPAGCPYQVKCLKSCVNVVLDFISPESVTECINFIDDRRVLPPEHKARKNLVEVKKMALDSIYAAVEKIQNL